MIIQLILGGILLGGVYALMAIGLTLIFGVMRIVNFAHGELVMLGMYMVFFLYSTLQIGPYYAILIVTPLMFVIGWILNQTLIKRLIGAEHVTQIFVTVGLSMMLSSGALMIFSGNFLRVQTSMTTKSVEIGSGILIGVPQLIAFIISMIVSAFMFLFLKRTMLGKAIRATTQNRMSSTLMGVDIKKIYAFTFAIGTALTGLSAALLMPMYPVFPTIGVNFVLMTFVVVVMGGLGSIPGALLGGLIIGVIETISAYYIDPGWKQAVYFTVFILLLVFRPQGFFGQIGAEEL
ncbi:branched-chain amino acid ABC transporter permease [Bacillus sp. EB106-08-02-XG196]|uniref:branched-chain amino acid ABC transporter permease n=1 Tax=Bacillus sp. EB106-08-02-XG196 TaxID=2737049 RepID=UPI0015C4A9A2|nr:branched-chain amino acid ABC transporter permease [Bacillus sp. EB106-08-02-XG196]NWQ43419.1 branched-chain amino acid ABC transporter permease [Bacillus sp. EB106-08-02-XG196]